MAQLARIDLHAEIEQRFADNTSEEITPLTTRSFLHELVDSAYLPASDDGTVPNVPTWADGTVYARGFLVRYSQAGGRESFYYALQAGLLPHPTYNQSDANWKLVPGPVPGNGPGPVHHPFRGAGPGRGRGGARPALRHAGPVGTAARTRS